MRVTHRRQSGQSSACEAGACVGFGTDRAMSTAASWCEGSHVYGPLASEVRGHPNRHCWADPKRWSGGIQ